MSVERLPPNRVYRFYRGGALLGRFRGQAEEDGPFPEDWVGSVTPASNPGRDEPDAGLSRLEDGRLLRDVVGAETGLLVKLLDSAERLPVHYHPDRAFAREHLGSPHGKTEAWIVLDTREARAEVWVGLREPVERERYRDWIERQDTDSLLGSLNRLTVQAGDVLYVPGGVPHAIGAGLLLAELQEPTDYSIVCEWEGFPIRAEDADLGLGWETALGALGLAEHRPIRGLPDEAREFFWADEVAEPAGRFAVWIVLEGEGTIDGRAASRGDCFAVSAATEQIAVEGGLRILRCLSADARPARSRPETW